MTEAEWDVWFETKRGKQAVHGVAVVIMLVILLVLRWVFGYEIAVLLSFAVISINLGEARNYIKRITEDPKGTIPCNKP